jgi:transposase
MLQHGIDLHKRTLTIATVDAEGSLVRRSKLPARRGDIVRYFDSLQGPHRAVVEATGSWYWVADLLRQQKVELKLAHARQLKAVAAAKVKTDAVDALTLAQLLRADQREELDSPHPREVQCPYPR